MLACNSPFPHAGSSALYRDTTLPPGMQRLELARIIQYVGDAGEALISLPLRLGANGNRRIAVDELIDGTPLTAADEDELSALQIALRARSRNRRKLQRRHDALRSRAIHTMILRSERAKLAAGQLEQPRGNRRAA